MGESGVHEYVERSRALLKGDPQMGEENTKVKLVQPLIDLLGWDVYSPEVELEYSMQIGRGHTRADYALLLEGTPVVFVEVKGCDATLTDTDRHQLKSYMRQMGVDWGLLTNGVHFEVLKRRVDGNRPDERSLGEFSLDELDENWRVLRLLSRELVTSGEAGRIAERMAARQRAVRRLREDKEAIAERVTGVVIEEVGDIPPQDVETESKAFVDALARSLGSESETIDAPTNPRVRTEPFDDSADEQRAGVAPSNRTRKQRSTDETEYVIALHGNEGTPIKVKNNTQSGAMAAAVDFLISDRDLVSNLEPLPYVPGEKNAILNTEPNHPSGEQMRLYEQLPSNYYLFTSLNRESKQRYVQQFAEQCGLTAEFDGSW